ncbi:hypothetical protein [Mesorhizobium sp. M0159]|uniref:IS66 family insertion sequence element accessory protein TnpA n=1 Tax=Mesorhizobium sp. M0159 TaxID=2956900 RepID=UPI0033372D31
MRHLESPEDRRKGAEYLRKLHQETPEKRGKKGLPKRRKSQRRYRYSVRTDTGPIALQAFWDTHVEAMNWSGLGLAEYAAALGLSPHALRKWRARLEEFEAEVDRRSLLHPSARAQLSSADRVRRQSLETAG